jgi:hypothetical protein
MARKRKQVPRRVSDPVRNDKSILPKPGGRSPKPPYLNSSIAAASASLPGRVTDSGSVASG